MFDGKVGLTAKAKVALSLRTAGVTQEPIPRDL
jgi:hypothetical protein